MDFEIPEHTKMLQRLAKDFVKRECLPIERELMQRDPDWIDLPQNVFMHLRSQVKELGLWALDVPKEYGGAGLDAISYCLIQEELNKTMIGTVHYSPMWTPLSAVVFPALYKGSEYQKQKYLYPLINGEKIAGVSQTEPESGSDAAAIMTTAVRDGDNWIINGIKRFTTRGEKADFFYLTAVTDKTKGRYGITVFLIDKNTPGFRLERIWPVMRPQYTTEIILEDCRIHDRQRLEGAGWDILQEGLDKVRMLLAQSMVGRSQRSLDIAIDYVQQRKTFGEPLSNRQTIQWMLVNSAMDVHLTRLLALEIAWKIDHGLEALQDGYMAKVYSTEMAFRVIDRCIQCLGGIGLSKDLPLERWFREVRVQRIVDGPNEILRMAMARNLFKRGWRP